MVASSKMMKLGHKQSPAKSSAADDIDAAMGMGPVPQPGCMTKVIGREVPVRVRHIASGRYLVVAESCRVYSIDDPAPEYKLTWGPVQVASVMIASTARAVASAWICMADDSSIEIEEVEL